MHTCMDLQWHYLCSEAVLHDFTLVKTYLPILGLTLMSHSCLATILWVIPEWMHDPYLRVHQQVRRRDAHIQRTCVREIVECEATRSHCDQPAGPVTRVCSARGEIQTIGYESSYVHGRPERAQQSSVRVQNDREYGEARRWDSVTVS
jgi:hypothetical protein